MMRTIVVGTAGHIDHGKSALVTALTGTDPDRLKEEKARGITIELGFAHAAIAADVVASFVDVPGHERFVRAMLAGAGGIDAVMLVVAADESVMPQTREHFDICRLLDVRCGLVAITKSDAVEPGMIDLVAAEVQELVAGSFLETAPIVPVSARSGAGLDHLRETLAELARALPARPRDGVLRLPIDRAFTLRGFGTVVTGTLVGGTLAVDDDAEILPEGRRVKIRGVHVHGGSRTTVEAGTRVAVNLSGVDVSDVPRGGVLTISGALAATRRADAHVTMLPGVGLKHGSRVRVHQGTAEVLARVAVVGDAGAIEPGGQADVRLRFESAAVLARGDRLVLRRYSPPATIGGGVVLDPLPPRPGVRTARGVARMAALRPRPDGGDDRRVAVTVFVEAAGPQGLTLDELGRRLGAPAATVLDGIVAHGTAVRAGEWIVATTLVDSAREALVRGLEEFHRAHAMAPGVGLEEARVRWFRGMPPLIVDEVLSTLARAGRLVVSDVIGLATHRVALSPEDTALKDWLDRRYREAGLSPPDVVALPGEARRSAADIDRVLALMIKARQLMRVDTLLFHPEVLDGLKRDISGLKLVGHGQATVDVKTFKDTYNLSRKFAIPLLEYLDRERITRRVGDRRLVL